jgi:hypothetical protein
METGPISSPDGWFALIGGTHILNFQLLRPPPKNLAGHCTGKSGTMNFLPLIASAARYPLRTAPSIVAGQPVFV